MEAYSGLQSPTVRAKNESEAVEIPTAQNCNVTGPVVGNNSHHFPTKLNDKPGPTHTWTWVLLEDPISQVNDDDAFAPVGRF